MATYVFLQGRTWPVLKVGWRLGRRGDGGGEVLTVLWDPILPTA